MKSAVQTRALANGMPRAFAAVRKAARQPEGEWVRVKVPEMSIVDEESWSAVQSRLAKRRRSDEAAFEASARLREWQNRRPVIRYAANESDQL